MPVINKPYYPNNIGNGPVFPYQNNIVQRQVQRPVMPQAIPQRPVAPQQAIRQPGPRAPSPIKKVYLQKTTKNKSFLDMHHYLKSIGVKNNAFMLTLIDPDLDGIDPYDPHLNAYYKQKILRECISNYW